MTAKNKADLKTESDASFASAQPGGIIADNHRTYNDNASDSNLNLIEPIAQEVTGEVDFTGTLKIGGVTLPSGGATNTNVGTGTPIMKAKTGSDTPTRSILSPDLNELETAISGSTDEVEITVADFARDQRLQVQQTGWVGIPPLVTIGAGAFPTTFSVTAGTGQIIQYNATTGKPELTIVNFAGVTDRTTPLLGGPDNIVNIYVDDTGTIFETGMTPGHDLNANNLRIADLSLSDNILPNDFILATSPRAIVSYQVGQTAMDFIALFGAFKEDGVSFSVAAGVGNERKLAHTSGVIFSIGAGVTTSLADPDRPPVTAEPLVPTTGVLLVEVWNLTTGGFEAEIVTELDTDSYVPLGSDVRASVPNNQYTLRPILSFPATGVVAVIINSKAYSTNDEAIADMAFGATLRPGNLSDGAICTAIAVQQDQDLDDVNTIFSDYPAGPSTGGGASGTTSQAVTRQNAYNNNPTALVNPTSGPFKNRVDPVGADADLMNIWANLADATTASVAGTGDAIFNGMSLNDDLDMQGNNILNTTISSIYDSAFKVGLTSDLNLNNGSGGITWTSSIWDTNSEQGGFYFISAIDQRMEFTLLFDGTATSSTDDGISRLRLRLDPDNGDPIEDTFLFDWRTYRLGATYQRKIITGTVQLDMLANDRLFVDHATSSFPDTPAYTLSSANTFFMGKSLGPIT